MDSDSNLDSICQILNKYSGVVVQSMRLRNLRFRRT